MANYYVNTNAQDNGDYEVHEDGCSWLAMTKSPQYLGDFSDCHKAVSAEKDLGYSQANGCIHCSESCHTS